MVMTCTIQKVLIQENEHCDDFAGKYLKGSVCCSESASALTIIMKLDIWMVLGLIL